MKYSAFSTVRRILRPLVLAVALLAMVGGVVLAQGGAISYGQTVTGSLTAEAPFALYTFNGTAGDHVTAYVMGVAPGLQPGLSLLGPDQRQLAVSSGDPLLGTDSSLARITYRLQVSGMHTLIVTNVLGTPGDFVLHIGARPSAVSMELPVNSPATFNIPPGAQPVRYSFNAAPDAPRTLLLSSDTPGFAFSAQVFDGFGQPVAMLGGSSVQGVSLILAPGSGLYEVAVAGQVPEAQGAVTLLLSSGTEPPGPAASTPAPVATEEVLPPGCYIETAGSTRVNIRYGPSTAFQITGSLNPGSPLEVMGQSADGTWFVVNNGGRLGWVSGSVTRLRGDCLNLPFFESPPTPTPPPATPTPTSPPGAVINFTVNGSGSATVIPGGCALVEWNTANVREVYYEGVGVSGVGSRNECPPATKTYTLRVVLQDGTETVRTVAIIVQPLVTLPPLILTPLIIVTLPGP
ncbi:MAG: hypothetical protein Kow0077_13830 [Anaerolineae bacterium]